MRRTKLVCTIGPASENEEILTKIIEAGMNASRHNFSHGDHEEGDIKEEWLRGKQKYQKN